MGQYYMPTLISEDGTVRTLYSHAYDNGLKLMEHSYIGNNFVNAVLTLLWESPCRLAWIGDYSDEQYGDPYEAKLPHEDFMQYYEAAWGDKRKEVQIKPEPRNILTMESTDTYLVNHTRRCYIHIGEYGGDKAGTLDAYYYKGPGARNGNEREFVAVKQPGRKYVVRRLTTTECARLQGLPDRWAIPLHKKSFTDEEGTFWERVRRTHAEANGRRYRPYAKREQLVCWYNRLRTDSSEYKLYGNGIALPCAAFVLRGVAMAFQE